MSKRRKALHGVLEQLTTEVEGGHVNEGAHVRLSKKLKAAFCATPSKRKHIRSYLREVLTDDPIAAISVPIKYRTILEGPEFLASLFRRKREELDEPTIPDTWWEDLLSGVAPEWIFEQLEDVDFLQHARGIVGVLIATDDEVLPHLEKHLDRMKIKPSALISVKNPEGYGEGWPEATHLFNADCRIIKWILKDDAYSEEDRKQLMEWSFDHSDPDMHRDPSWREALGLRGLMDVMSCVISRALGKSFAEAREMAMAKYGDDVD
jgi:hypothetical protein